MYLTGMAVGCLTGEEGADNDDDEAGDAGEGHHDQDHRLGTVDIDDADIGLLDEDESDLKWRICGFYVYLYVL